MKLTPYKDKNGKPIYEGDIVRFKYYGQNYFTEVVSRYKDDFLPFADIPVKYGIGNVDPEKCEIISVNFI